jgi:hypothetical protein
VAAASSARLKRLPLGASHKFRKFYNSRILPMNKFGPQEQSIEDYQIFRIGGIAAISAICIVMLEGLLIFNSNFETSTAINWFSLIEKSRIMALLNKAFLDIIFVMLVCPMYFAIYTILKQTQKAYITNIIILVFIGIAAYIPINTSFSILFAADLYKENPLLLTSAEGLQAIGKFGLFYSMGFFIVTLANILLSILFLQNQEISRWITIIGLTGNGLILLNYFSFIFVPTTDVVGTILLPIGGTLILLWYLLLGISLIRIGSLKLKSA